ncbi:MAG: hypothetical protein ACREDX_04265 [Aestuariivirga sp.]
MPHLLRIFLPLLSLLFASVAVAGQAPAGYVVSVFLNGDDATAKTSVVREGKELPPKLMMPVYSGDVVFVRDPASRVSLEIGDGETVEIGGNLARYNVQGEIPTGDDAWSVLTAIGGVLSEEADEVPENMASKGDETGLRVPLAVHGRNFLVKGERKLWLAWQGGTAPFTVSAKFGEKEIPLAPATAREIEVAVPADAGDRLAITIRDAGGQTVTLRFRLRDELPALPDSLKKASPGPSAGTLLTAAWLASLADGAWTVEAAQMLHRRVPEDQAAARLLARMAKGWKP